MNTKDILTLVIAAVGAAVALATLIKACLEYVRQGRMARAQMFFDLRRRLKEPHLAQIAEWIDEESSGDPVRAKEAYACLAQLPLRDKRDYLGLFEEVDIAMASGLIRPRIALYMFGYYALRCAQSEAFWNGIGPWNPYWDRFFDFCRKMQAEERRFERDRQRSLLEAWGSLPTAASATAPGADMKNNEPTVTIKMPPILRFAAQGLKEVEVSGETVGEALTHLVEQYPALRAQIFQLPIEGNGQLDRLNPYVNVYYRDEDVRGLAGLDTPVQDGSLIMLLPSMSGG